MPNLLDAMVNIVQGDHYKVEIAQVMNGSNRANNMGEGLEMFVKNAFSNNFNVSDPNVWNVSFWSAFSFQGTKSKIPDMVLKGAEAIEVKKTESLNSLQLNSSHPKAKLFSDQNVSEECRLCEGMPWKEKDMIYVMGHVPKNSKKLQSLWFVYGTCYAAKKETYQDVVSEIKGSLAANANIEINVDGKELGKVTNIDSLGATDLRIRGMWVIKHPSRIFEGLYKQKDEVFSMIAIIPNDIYASFPDVDRDRVENNAYISVVEHQIANPNNAAKPMSIKLVKFVVSE